MIGALLIAGVFVGLFFWKTAKGVYTLAKERKKNNCCQNIKTTKMFLKSFLILLYTITAVLTLPTQTEIENSISRGAHNIIYYVIGAVILIGFMIVLCLWQAVKGIWVLLKIGLLVGSGAALFYLIVQGFGIRYFNNPQISKLVAKFFETTKMSFKSLLIILIAITTLTLAAPTQKDITDEISKEVPKHIIYYIIGALIVVGVIIILLCWTAAKGCCCLLKIGLLVGCGFLLFFFIVKGTIDYKEA
ncbi:hypothetical protein PVAND_017554 [Polypedilum vanderplanki]|uniref:Uncharacterized protein n=1 Tax=Polypedilum vanderplanki TaxID=319348 RepID=A0A9J6BJD2_POLVA|nr:hypothetical protein PVAND_017554 [Polypedilum vanderplanki]